MASQAVRAAIRKFQKRRSGGGSASLSYRPARAARAAMRSATSVSVTNPSVLSVTGRPVSEVDARATPSTSCRHAAKSRRGSRSTVRATDQPVVRRSSGFAKDCPPAGDPV